jgi:hypothetical protein
MAITQGRTDRLTGWAGTAGGTVGWTAGLVGGVTVGVGAWLGGGGVRVEGGTGPSPGVVVVGGICLGARE